jgi:hypothetical protein
VVRANVCGLGFHKNQKVTRRRNGQTTTRALCKGINARTNMTLCSSLMGTQKPLIMLQRERKTDTPTGTQQHTPTHLAKISNISLTPLCVSVSNTN